MASCEKCWSDAYTKSRGSGRSQTEVYSELVKQRDCTPEEQAGMDAKKCKICKRTAVHQMINVCMACGARHYKDEKIERETE